MKESPIDDDHGPIGSPSLWQENHGNLLLIFLAIIFLVGAGILAYRQNRFRPPRFPSADAIQNPAREKPLSPEQSVVVAVSGAGSDAGTIMIAVYGSSANFNDPGKAIFLQSLDVQNGAASWSIRAESLPQEFAIAAFHDENGDGTLNRNPLGIPTERYGFSRNARGLTGPPEFTQALIDRPRNGEQVAVFIR
jgi:uncharacterized protein (DUF2141 family)